MNIFDTAVDMAIKQKKCNFDTILDNMIKIRQFLDKYPAVSRFALTGKGNNKIKNKLKEMLK